MVEPEPQTTTTIRVEPVPNCPVCDGPGALHRQGLADRLCRAPGRWDFYRCARDGNLWLNPRPVEEDLGLCYPAGYFTHTASSPTRKSRRNSSQPGAKERLRRRI